MIDNQTIKVEPLNLISQFLYELRHKNLRIVVISFLFISILIFGIYLRFSGINWDEGYIQHPDERNIALAVSKINFPYNLNPEFHAYNNFYIYLSRIVGEIVSAIQNDYSFVTEWGKINLITRSLSALSSVLSIILFFFLCKSWFSSNLKAILGIFLFTTTIGLIQYAHYGVTESFLLMILLLIILLSENLYRKPTKLRNWFLLSIGLSIGIATKTTGVFFLIIPAITIFSLILEKKANLEYIIYFFVSIILFTFIFTPYTFLDFANFEKSVLQYENKVVDGSLKVPYTMQFESTTPYIFQIINLIWQLGPVTWIASFLGIFASVSLLLKNNKYNISIIGFLLFSFVYFVYVGSFYNKFIRYMIFVIPFLVFMSVIFIDFAKKYSRKLAVFLLVIIISFNIVFAYSYTRTFLDENTRLKASRWFYKNIPEGSVVLQEHWDDKIPIQLRNISKTYQNVELKLFDKETPSSINTLVESIVSADIIAISSKRLYGVIPRNPEYPITKRYYEKLFNGSLGFNLVAEFSNYINIFGIDFNDDIFEETVQVYDRAKVLIFQKNKNLTKDEILNLLFDD